MAPGDKEQARRNVIAGPAGARLAGAGQDDLCPDQRDRHPLHVPRRGGRGGAGRAPARHGADSQGRACRRTSTWWTRCSRRSRRRRAIPHRIGIDVLIETALGMANVEAIAQSSRRLEAMHFGVADYAASCRARTVSIGGLNPDYPGRPVARRAVADGRRVPGLRAPADRRPVRRLQGSRRLHRAAARRGAALGIEGKWAIHPSQIALANDVFTPPPTEVDRARRILVALDEAAREGAGPRSSTAG